MPDILDLFYFDDSYTIALVLALAATVLSFIFIIPESKKAKLNGFFTFLHNTFNFKYLVIEKILQFVYVFSTFSTIVLGIFIMFDVDFVSGLLVVLFSPIVIRIIFELSMMVIIAIKNIIEINNKLPNKNEAKQENAPKHEAAPQHNYNQQYAQPQSQQTRFCPNCGSPMNVNGTCTNPNCPKYYN